LKTFLFILLFLAATAYHGKTQDRRFIGGAMIGAYGIHNQGEIREMYSPTNGKLWGTGGYSYGINIKRHVSDFLYVALELRHTRKGSLYEFITTYGTQGFESIKLDYVEIPLMLGFPVKVKQKNLLLESGMSYSWLFRSVMSVNDLNYWDTSEKTAHLKKHDLSVILNVKYPVNKNQKLLLGIRFYHSISSIHAIYKLYNMGYGIELYYLFNRGSE
jgi:hypothetical protein